MMKYGRKHYRQALLGFNVHEIRHYFLVISVKDKITIINKWMSNGLTAFSQAK